MALALGSLLWPLKINVELNSLDESVENCRNIRQKLLSGNDNEFSLTVHCSDFEQYNSISKIKVTPFTNVADLKKRYSRENEGADVIHQCWIFGNRIPQDYEYLKDLGVNKRNPDVHLLLKKDGYRQGSRFDWLDFDVEPGYINVILDQIDLAEQAIKINEWDEALDHLDALQDLIPSNTFNLQITIEDIHDVYTKVNLPVSSDMTFKELSSLASTSFSIPKPLIKWIFARRVIDYDSENYLSQMSVTSQKSEIYLFVLSPESAGVSITDIQDMHEKLVNNFIESRSSSISVHEKPIDIVQLNDALEQISISHEEQPEAALLAEVPIAAPPQVVEPQIPMWTCEVCTLSNLPLFRTCSICGVGIRTPGFQIPANYVATPEEFEHERMMKIAEDNELLTLQFLEQEKQDQNLQAAQAYQQYLRTDDAAVIFNVDEIECPICLLDIEPGEAIILRECLHQVCVNCLKQHVTNSESIAIQCPTATDAFSCTAVINDREIAAIVSEEEFHKYKMRGLLSVEAALPSFHCRTPNCDSWWELVGEVNSYNCESCGKENCLICKAIHTDMTCKEYQDDLRIRAENDEAAKATQTAIDNMIKNGEAMHCPKCKLIIQKRSGCDWMQCSMCRTELCWATKGARWGPNGPGDTSGGCQCGVNGRRCIQTCGGCH